MKRLGFGLERPVVTIGVFVAIVAHSWTSAAEDRLHDGLYLRLGGGLGYAIDSIESDPVAGVKGEGTATGLAGVTELAVGASLADGFVLGGGLYSALVFSPKASNATLSSGGVQLSGDIDFDASSFHVLGPFADFYFDAREGFHLQGGLGFAWLSAGDAHYRASVLGVPVDVSRPATGGTGFGLMIGVGNEWWVGDVVSIGILGRLTMGFMSGDDTSGPVTVTWHHSAFAPALLFTATFN